MRLLLVDPSVAGISGDMLIAALLDLGAKEELLEEVAELIREETGKRFELELEEVERKGIACRQVRLRLQEDFRGMGYGDIRGYLEGLLERCDLSESALGYARRCLNTLIEGEARIHHEEHLHELGSVDTLFDILGSASLLDSIKAWECRVISSPVNVGSGRVKTSHGELSVPLPLVAEILRAHKVPFFKRHNGELTTPTGLALLVNLVEEFSEELPVVRVLSVGRGAGGRELAEAPNMLQLYLCEAPEVMREQMSLLETSVDDVTGEVLGNALEELMGAGALDVQLLPTVTKKNRPGYLLQVICRVGEEQRLAELVMRLLGTLGVRHSRVSMRFALRREVRRIRVRIGDHEAYARVKLGLGEDGSVVTLKPEYEDAVRIAESLSLPVREVLARIACEARKQLG